LSIATYAHEKFTKTLNKQWYGEREVQALWN